MCVCGVGVGVVWGWGLAVGVVGPDQNLDPADLVRARLFHASHHKTIGNNIYIEAHTSNVVASNLNAPACGFE